MKIFQRSLAIVKIRGKKPTQKMLKSKRTFTNWKSYVNILSLKNHSSGLVSFPRILSIRRNVS